MSDSTRQSTGQVPATVAAERAVDNLRSLVRIPTVSHPDEQQTRWEHFDHYIAELSRLYPALHAALQLERVARYSLLYRWPGREGGAPSVLMAHYDVVPAEDDGWQHPPFSASVVGEGEDQVVWGRGTLDDKGSMVAILEAVETLVTEGFTPQHDVYLSFGHNEETAGDGARAIVSLLAEREIAPRLVLDEGGAVVQGIFPGVDDPIAVIGVAEKGIMTLTMTVDQQGGHASTPPRLTATTRLARAIVRLSRKPFPSRFSDVNLEMIRTIGARARQPLRFAFTRLALTKPLLLWLFTRLGDETSAIVRTTQAVTRLSGSLASNALAERAVAEVNIRVAVGSSVADTVGHVRRAVRDPGVQLDVVQPSEPSPVSPTTGWAWELLRDTVLASYPGTIVTPYVMLGASDSRHYCEISEHVYRFSPFEMSDEERGTLHAVNERIRVATFLRGVGFFNRLLRSL